jgi:hypothetical protein
MNTRSLETAAGIASVAAYLTGVLAGYLHRHSAGIAAAALLAHLARTRASRLGR